MPQAPTGAALEEGRAGQADNQQRNLRAFLQQVFQQVQRAVVSPMDIVEEQHRRALTAGRRKKASSVVKRPVADLLRVAEDPPQVRAVEEIKADEVAEKVCGLGAFLTRHGAEAEFQLG